MICHKSQSGFTYLEMLISLALLGIMSIGLAGSFDFGRQVWKRAETYTNIEQTIILRDNIRGWVEEITNTSDLNGTAQKVTFNVQSQITPDPSIVNLKVSIHTQQHQGVDALFLTLIGHDRDNQIIFEDVRAIQHDLNQINISYYGSSTPTELKKWHTEWDHPKGALNLIKITAQSLSGAAFIPLTMRVGKAETYKKISASSLLPPD